MGIDVLKHVLLRDQDRCVLPWNRQGGVGTVDLFSSFSGGGGPGSVLWPSPTYQHLLFFFYLHLKTSQIKLRWDETFSRIWHHSGAFYLFFSPKSVHLFCSCEVSKKKLVIYLRWNDPLWHSCNWYLDTSDLFSWFLVMNCSTILHTIHYNWDVGEGVSGWWGTKSLHRPWARLLFTRKT